MNDEEDIARQLAARDRFRKRRLSQLTPEQNLAEMAVLQQATWDVLRSSPAGYAHFLKRNFKARAIRSSVGERPDAT